MLLYRTLRQLTLALRSLQVGLIRATSLTAVTAQNAGAAAKAAALAHLDRTEDRARTKVLNAVAHTEAVMEKLLDAEDDAQWAYESVCYENSTIRGNILNEVL